jgi:ABC-type uncharacterized transport system substrate-binding protein
MASQHTSRRRFLALCLASGFGLRAWPALAADNPRVIVLLSGDEAPYRQVFAALRAARMELQFQVLLPTEALPRQAGTLLIALGQKAVQYAASQNYPGPVLAALIPRAGYRSVIEAMPAAALQRWSALVLDQPWPRQLALVRQVLPKARTLGLAYGDGSAEELPGIRAATGRFDLALDARRVGDEQELFSTLRQLLGSVDAMWAIPDSQVINRSTLKGYLLSAYRANVPVFAYSQALVEAGALAGIYTPPEDVGLDLADLLPGLLEGHPAGGARLVHPHRFKLKINHGIARSLGIVLADEEQLRRQIESRSGS